MEPQSEERKLDQGPPRELKFKVPSEFQRKLYGLKIVTGKNLSHLVTEAVGAYLQQLEQEQQLDPNLLASITENANKQTV
jgi:predicted DNA-binding protein